ncbi:adenylyltransferase/cytidyltransferase family protein [Micromonospora sp. BQ11]
MVEGKINSHKTRVYVDMVGDLFHPGHVALLRAARGFGDWLIVGVLSDETVASYKRRPIMSLAERVSIVEACRYVDEVVPDSPYQLTPEFLDEMQISVVVHGDDISPEVIEAVYGPIAADGRLQLVKYTAGVSTTDLINRVKRYLA